MFSRSYQSAGSAVCAYSSSMPWNLHDRITLSGSWNARSLLTCMQNLTFQTYSTRSKQCFNSFVFVYFFSNKGNKFLIPVRDLLTLPPRFQSPPLQKYKPPHGRLLASTFSIPQLDVTHTCNPPLNDHMILKTKGITNWRHDPHPLRPNRVWPKRAIIDRYYLEP